MLLALDIGNSNPVLGAFHGEQLVQHWRVAPRADATGDELGVALRGLFGSAEVSTSEVSDVIVSSVVPVLNESVVDMSDRYLGIEPLVVGPGIRTGIQIRDANPQEAEADGIVTGG